MNKFFLSIVLTGLSLLGHVRPVAAQSVIHFCGEVLPANQPAIFRKWTTVLAHQAAQPAYLNLLKQRSAVVFPLIEPIIAQYDIPADFKYLLLVESGGQNYTVSRSGAAGFWQLMPQTARTLGLSVSSRHDDRYDLRKSTSAACRYLRELYEQFGSWTLVAAAYNAGPNHVQALHRRFPDEHALSLPYQARETKSYVFQAVALKEFFTNPQSYANYLSVQTIAQLSLGNTAGSEGDPAASLTTAESGPDAAVAESTLTPEDDTQNPVRLSSSARKADVAALTEPAALQLETRSVSDEALTEGKLFLFEVVRPVVINGVAVTVGDLVYAHVETLDPASGRAFLRTEKVVSVQTQTSTKLQLVAVEKTRQPGVQMPARDALASGWKLSWEQL